MTNEELRSHIGCLICINHELYWFTEDRWDGVPERFCILLAVDSEVETQPAPVARVWSSDWKNDIIVDHHLQLLIDDKPQWVTLNTEFFEIVK